MNAALGHSEKDWDRRCNRVSHSAWVCVKLAAYWDLGLAETDVCSQLCAPNAKLASLCTHGILLLQDMLEIRYWSETLLSTP